MKKRIIILLLIAVILLGIATPVAAGGPPWPAFVIVHNDALCSFWFKWAENHIDWEGYIINGNVTYEYQAKNDEWNANCHFRIDFNAPSVVQLKEVCAAFPDMCSSRNGTLIWRDFGCYGGVDQYGNLQYTDDAQYTVNPSGQSTLTCHFHPNNP